MSIAPILSLRCASRVGEIPLGSRRALPDASDAFGWLNRRMERCSTCGVEARQPGRFCTSCGKRMRRGLRWYVAIPVALASGLFAFFMGVLDDDGQSRNPDVRRAVEFAIVAAIATALVVLWFTWLRFSVRRWRIARRHGC
jgi:hypothetical protein